MKKKRQTYCQIEHVELRRLLSTIFVSSAATAGGNNGTSWTDAYTDLQIALSHANSGDVVAVAQGTYKPTSTTDRTASFHLVSGVTIEGGFEGTGSSGPRDPALYPTILSGDIGAAGNSDNSYHVVYARSVDNTAVLDGFTITSGNADFGFDKSSEGGGVFDFQASPTINDCTISGNAATGGGGGVVNLYSSATLTNCTISGNTSGARGGGIYDYQSSPTLTNCTISANTANANAGGGISNKKSSDPILTNCTITGNTAATGGGIANYSSSSPELTDCILTGNTATEEGGGVWNFLNSSPTLVNCVISGNTATSAGGGIFSEFTSNPALTNCTLSGNTANNGGAIYNNSNASTTIANSIVWNDTASTSGNEVGAGAAGTNTTNISFSDVEGGSSGVNNNIVADPKFIRAVGNGGPGDFGNLRLEPSSPVINLGSSSASGLNGITTDLDGLSRTNGGFVDMGAYEAHYAFQSTVFVDASATGANTGSTWTDAYSNLAVALDYAVAGETVDVAQGTYYASTDASRFDTFQLVDGVILQGGFAGQANPNAAQDVSTYTTTLSGDIGTPGVIGDNTYNVVTGSGTNNTAILDGFTITAGYASNYHPTGGGIIDFSGSPTITDSIISGNTSTGAGGGMFNYQSSPILNDCTINGNTGRSGGGLDNEHESSPVLTDCTISGNMANQNGGGIYNDYSSPTLVSCTITGNTASLNGGGISNYVSSATLTNCTLSGNTADSAGGGMYDSKSSPALTNCTFSGNSAIGGGAIFNEGNSSIPILINCILWDDNAPSMNEIGGSGSAVVSFSDIDQTGFAGSNNNVDVDPMFVDPTHHNYRIKVVSPVANAGLNSAIAGTSTDLDGNPRIINSTVDLGAYETRPIIFVDASATGTGDGSSFANAFTTLTAALGHAIAGSGQSIDVAQGTYKPTAGTDRAATFNLLSGVNIEGGFAGDTNANPVQRNVALFPTILSGDIGQAGLNTDNSYAVVTVNEVNSAELAGFTVMGGYCSRPEPGGGIVITSSDFTVHDCIISGNDSLSEGGGMYLNNDILMVTDCKIENNYALTEGGGAFISYCSANLVECTFSNNNSGSGAGIFAINSSDLELTDCIVSENSARYGGGVEFDETPGILTNSVLVDNSADSRGGAIYDGLSNVTLTNCTITGNTSGSGGAIYNYYSNPSITNSIVWGNTASTGNEISNDNFSSGTVAYSDIDQSGYAASNNNIDADPQFVRPVGTNGPTDFGDLHILNTSPAVNVGSNAAIPNGITTDVVGNTRIIQSTVDMGAYEAQFDHLVFDVSPPNTNVAGHSFSFEVDIEDGNGNDVLTDTSTVSVQITGNPSGATLNGSAMLAADQGQAIFSGLNITHAGTYTLSASDGSLPGATSGSFTITPAAPASLTITQQPTNTTAGQTISSIQVQAKDQYGNLADGSSISVAIASGPGTTFGGTTTLPTSGGVASFSNLSLTAAGAYTLSFSDDSLAPVTSNSFTISPAAAAQLVITQQPANGTVGQTLPAVNVEVEDQFGNDVDGASVTLSIASGPSGSTLGGTLTESTTANGIATFDDLSLNNAGAYTLSASGNGLPAIASNSFTVGFAGPSLIFSTEPASAAAGAKLSSFTIETVDTSGTLITTGKSTVTLTLSSNGKIYGSTKAKLKNGMATFKNLSLHTAGAYTLTATNSGFASAVSSSFTISAGAPKKLSFATQPANTSVNTPFNVSVNLLDQYGNAADDGSTVTLLLGSHPKTASSLNLSATASDGSADFDNITLSAAGNYTLKASDGKAKATSKKFVASSN